MGRPDREVMCLTANHGLDNKLTTKSPLAVAVYHCVTAVWSLSKAVPTVTKPKQAIIPITTIAMAMESQTPPPYSTTNDGSLPHPDTAARNTLLTQLARQANLHYGPNWPADSPPEVHAALSRETERIRNMMEFTLSVDYQGYTGARISPADRVHFHRMVEAVRKLKRTVSLDKSDPEVRPSPEERETLAAYFWKYLHEPCKALALPLDTVVHNMICLDQFTSHLGEYKGSVFGVLHQDGHDGLAEKLYMDREVLVPKVFSDHRARQDMIEAVKAVERMYFDRIEGVEQLTYSNPQSYYRDFCWVKYEANERGLSYALSRKTAIARAYEFVSAHHWIKVVGECVKGIVARFTLVKLGKRAADPTWASWRGENSVLPFGGWARDYNFPRWSWMTRGGYHVPDYFEFRNQVGTSDV
ncbi:hypothetical protein TI39_contig334g00008 [Zymoseptoria brevis]|uniref:Uncharacterized protein n=1 Tax=Zymoseptoria brevis TaxID=1047168 RepID=A0A0F4GSF6_9PEZI|nr:hypothetical protein TI39_contig334g00008 [Zymoseptoria brevis]